MKNNNELQGGGYRQQRASQQEDKVWVAIVAALDAGQAPMLDDLKSVWTSKEANRVIRELSRQGVAGVHRRRLHKVDGVKYRFGVGRVEQKGPGRFLLIQETVGVSGSVDTTEAYLTAKSSKLVVSGDTIKAFLAAEDDSDVEALPVSLVERDSGRQHVARARETDGHIAFFLDNRVEDVRLDMPVVGAKAGDIWFCEVQERGLLRDIVPALATHRIGNELDKGIESELAFTSRFPESARCIESQWPSHLTLADAKDVGLRRDIRDIPLATIDGESTSDFDDAIAAAKSSKGGWDIWVGIADVSAFVTPGSNLDAFALKKMTSVYLPHEVHPMLPRSLSNGVCSLNPNEDRLALCCKLHVNAAGEVDEYEFFRATMKSHARLTYVSTQEYLDKGVSLGSVKVEESIKCLNEAAVAMRAAGIKDGRLDMGDDEISFTYGVSGKIESLKSSARLWSHKIVEECMLAANCSAAELVDTQLATGIFRNHAGIKESGMADLHETLDALGIKAGSGLLQITQAKIAEILEEAKSIGKYAQARSAILSGMSSANYETDNTGHFSLVAPYYCHFTSPIRRYADLMVHRMIKATLDTQPSPYSRAESEALCVRASKFSQLASQAENEARKLLILDYVKKFQGQTMEAKISTIGERGLWVALPFPGASLEFFVAAKPMKNAGMQWSDQEQSWMSASVPLVEGGTIRCAVASCDAGSRRVELAPETAPRPEAKGSGVKV